MVVTMLRLLVALTVVLVGCGRETPRYQLVHAEGTQVRLARSEVEDGRVHFFSYEESGGRVNFLVRTDGEGSLHTHFDACHSCYRYRRGFVVEGPELVCIACRLAYPIEDDYWEFIGACAPISIPFSIDGDTLVIDREVLERGRRFFS